MPRPFTEKNTATIRALLAMLTKERLTMKVACARLGVSTQEGHRWLFTLGVEHLCTTKTSPGPGRAALVYTLTEDEARIAAARLDAHNDKWAKK